MDDIYGIPEPYTKSTGVTLHPRLPGPLLAGIKYAPVSSSIRKTEQEYRTVRRHHPSPAAVCLHPAPQLTERHGIHMKINPTEHSSTATAIFTNSAQITRVLNKGSVEINGDTVELSEEAMQALAKAQKEADEKRESIMTQAFAEQNAAVAKQQAEACEDYYTSQGKLMEIARRIAKGDIVPFSDEQKLMEFSNDLYQMAKQAALLSREKERKKHDALFDEEDGQNDSSTTDDPSFPSVDYEVKLEIPMDIPAESGTDTNG